jgi:N-methylhydantoinase A
MAGGTGPAGGDRVGIDIGGTFTDAVLVDEHGELTVAKVPTTPSDYAAGFADAFRRVVRRAGRNAGAVSYIAHG